MRDLRRKLAYHFREGGLRGVARRLVSYPRQRGWSDSEWLVYERVLTEDLAVASEALVRRELSFNELKAFGYDKAIAFPEAIKRRFQDHNVCHGFYVEGQLTTLGWSSPDYLELDQDLRFPCPGTVGLFDFTTYERFRSRGYYTNALLQLFVAMRKIGFGTACIAVDPGNLPSIKGIERAGFRLQFRFVRRWRLGLPIIEKSLIGSEGGT